MPKLKLLFLIPIPRMTTQIGGKYSKYDNGIFLLKEKLLEVDINVTHPIGNRIIDCDNGVPIAFSKENGLTLFDVELDYYNSIKTSSFHIVFNKYLDVTGYIGKNVSLEIAYAMIFNKPVILLFKDIIFNKNVDNSIARIITDNKDKLIHVPFEQISTIANLKLVQKEYHLDFFDEVFIINQINDMITSYKHDE